MMATFLDVTGLAQFSSIFVFLFAWIIIYAVFLSTRIFADNKVIAILASFILGIFVLLSPAVTSIVQVLAPWITIGFMFIVLVTAVSKLMIGDAPAEISLELRGVLLVFIIVIIFVAVVAQYREHITIPGDEGTSDDVDGFTKPTTIIFHPKVMGTILILAIAVFTIALLTSRVS